MSVRIVLAPFHQLLGLVCSPLVAGFILSLMVEVHTEFRKPWACASTLLITLHSRLSLGLALGLWMPVLHLQ